MKDTCAPLRSPEEVFDGDNLPDDLKWIITHFGLPKNDPSVVLLSWHWHRMHQNQEIIDSGVMQFKATLDPRIAKIKGYADAIERVKPALDRVVRLLDNGDVALKGHVKDKLQQPVDQTLFALKELLEDLRKAKNQLTWEKYLAVYLGGLASGALIIVCALLR